MKRVECHVREARTPVPVHRKHAKDACDTAQHCHLPVPAGTASTFRRLLVLVTLLCYSVYNKVKYPQVL